ncbi:MAG: Crp/Fnr family transcriptional regulator [Defluviicoccus sp.]|nr:Crp/Fnr family transcriptional regulator [Defluviicoccus sp.]
MKPPTPEQLSLIHAGSWFGSLPTALQSELLSIARIVTLPSGHRLFARGAVADGLYTVLEGSVRVSMVSDSGKEAILNIFVAPHWFGEIALFDGNRRTHDAWTNGETTLLHVPQAPLLALLERQPRYWQDLGRLLTHKIRHLLTMMDDSALQPAPVRLARRLLSIADGYGELQAAAMPSIRIPQEQLGQMVAVTRQTVNQILRQFEADGLIRLGRSDIRILDREALRRLAP